MTGTQAGLPSTRLSDCSSFLLATATPSPKTHTVTATVTSVQTAYDVITTNPVYDGTTTVTEESISRFLPSTATTVPHPTPYTANTTAVGTERRRAVTQTHAVPSYATSACPFAPKYSSACSCAGVTVSTTTLPAETVTTTETVTAVTTSIVYTAATTTLERTATATQVAVESGYPCGLSIQGNGIYQFRSYHINCGQRVTGGTVQNGYGNATESECLRECNSIKYCVYASYQFSTRNCDLYYNEPTSFVADADYDGIVLD